MKKLESAAKDAAGKEDSKELESLREQLKQLQAEKQKLENDLKDCLEKNKTMEDKIKSLESGDAAAKALQDELEALKAENKKLAEGGGADAKQLKEMEDECEAKLAALRSEHQKELERREQVHRENLETCQMELNELKGKLQESDKTLQLNLDKDKNKEEYAKEYEDEISRLEKQNEMLTKNLKADLEAKNAELDTLRFEMTKENNDLRKQLEKCMADCDSYRKELEELTGVARPEKSVARVGKTQSEPLPTDKDEESGKKDKAEKEGKGDKKEKGGKGEKGEKKGKGEKEPKSDEAAGAAAGGEKSAKKADGAAAGKKKPGVATKGAGRADTTSKSKLEEAAPEAPKKGDGVCHCMDHPLVKIIYKILHGGTEVLNTEEILYLHKKLCAECRTALGPPRNEAEIRARTRKLKKEILEREEKMTKQVEQLEESLHEGKLFLERLYERYAEKRKEADALQQKKMASPHQASAARRTASGTAIGSKNQPWMGPAVRAAAPTGPPKMTVRSPG